ncbi:MAG: hypothetical protein K8R91_02345 [Phycisphaerae bacterium]|nr:hypothetical protein [Phycisphaerae bacterium]
MEKINELNPVKLYFISRSGFTQQAEILLKEQDIEIEIVGKVPKKRLN